jgi:ABC-2 type transport system ATP-binding protein
VTAVIELDGLTKAFGDVRALDGVDLEVEKGSVFGFLGPNGAGKTTTLKILTGLARPTAGTARVLGHDVVRAGNDVRSAIGFLPDVPAFYPWMTAEETMRFYGALFGLGGAELDARVSALLDLAGLAGVESKVGGYSRGMRQRLGVAQALVNAPRLLMLDEPTSALDPIGRKDVLDMIGALEGRTTVFFSTHILTDAERVCDTVAVLDRGRVVRQGPIGELKRAGGAMRISMEVEGEAGPLAEALEIEPWCLECTRDGAILTCAVGDLSAARSALPAMVADRGLGLVRLAEEEPTLEDVFVGLVGGER